MIIIESTGKSTSKMDCSENYCGKLNSKLQSDQSKLKDKQQELCKLNGDLHSVEQKWKERKQLNSQINEKTKSIELLFRRVKSNFDAFPSQIDDLDAYARQALQNKHKFEVPINEFQQSLDSSLTKLNDQINQKIDAIKSKYQTIIDKLQAKKEHLERLTNSSSSEYEQLQDELSKENQNIARLEDEIRKKQNQIQETTSEITRNVELAKQLEMKNESTLKANQCNVQEIANLNVQFKKADEDKKSIESKIRMQDELIDCTRLMIQELENNVSSNLNYQKYKGEYDLLEEQVRLLQSEHNDRTRIHQMKTQCKALRKQKVEQINRVLQGLKSVEAEEHLSDEEREAQYASIIGDIQNEIKSLESEVGGKGLISRLNMTQQVTQSNLITQQAIQSHLVTHQTRQSMETACDQLKDKPDNPQKTTDNSSQFELVPEELLGYLYDTKIILFGSQDEEANEPVANKVNRSKETNEPASAAELDAVLRSIENRAESCILTGSYALDEFTNPVIPEIFTSSVPRSTSNAQSESTQIDDARPPVSTQQSPIESTSLQVSESSTQLNQFVSFSNPSVQSRDSEFETPRTAQSSGGEERQTKDTSKRKKHSDSSGSDKTKRKRQH